MLVPKPTENGQNDRFIKKPKTYAAATPYATSIAISARPRTPRGSSPAPRPIQADASIWNGSHGPTPAVTRADANRDVQPRTNPKPGPYTRPDSTKRKNTVSIPDVPAPSGRSAALTADRTPSIASAFESMPPSLNDASTTAIRIGSTNMKTNGASLVCPVVSDVTLTNSGQQNITIPARLAMTKISAVRGPTRTTEASRARAARDTSAPESTTVSAMMDAP